MPLPRLSSVIAWTLRGGSAVLMVLLIVMWVRSYWIADFYSFSPRVGWRYCLFTLDGRIGIQIFYGQPKVPESITAHSTSDLINARAYLRLSHGVSESSFVTVVPIVAIVLTALIALPPLLRRYRRLRVLKTAHCASCGYDLRAHAPGEKCPECGTPVPELPRTKVPGPEARQMGSSAREGRERGT